MIGIVVDSNSQMPLSLAARFGIVVVPVPVTVDGVEFLEGVELDADRFYDAWHDDHAPEISTSAPSPGQFVAAYERLVERGATELLSVHVGEALSATLSSARLAAQRIPVPVRLVDTATASFGISCCAWAAAEAIAEGAGLEEAAGVAERRAHDLGTCFVVGVPALTERSGRAEGVGVGAAAAHGIPVLGMHEGTLEVLATVQTLHAAVVTMADYALNWTPSTAGGLRIAVGTSDATSVPVARAITDTLEGHPAVGDVVQYRVGPSVGAHTGPGTAGLFVF